MHRMICLFFSVVLLASPAHGADVSLEGLRWLAGCWGRVDADPGSGETWMPPAGGSMLGMSRTVRQGRTTTWEFVRIVENKDGGVEYVASPAGQATATFTLVRASEEEAVFENPKHDFPQRVIYRRLADGGLLGRIEGILDGESRSVDFPMQRIACEDHGGSS